jgi:formate hydrogenlyase subunit 3/multisubunit Na+/H+ antiporter MnhD subunit
VTYFDIIGMSGVFLCLLAYSLNLLERLPTESWLYPALNAVSSGLILVSLAGDFNLASAMMEGSWLGVSLLGMVRALSRSRKANSFQKVEQS